MALSIAGPLISASFDEDVRMDGFGGYFGSGVQGENGNGEQNHSLILEVQNAVSVCLFENKMDLWLIWISVRVRRNRHRLGQF
jgi:hypothetical protein